MLLLFANSSTALTAMAEFVIAADVTIPHIFLCGLSDKRSVELMLTTKPAYILAVPFSREQLSVGVMFSLKNDAHPETANQHKPRKDVSIADDVASSEPLLCVNGSIFIKLKSKYMKIAGADITYLKAEGNFTFIHTSVARYIIRQSLTNVLKKVSDIDICRVHRSYAINSKCMDGFDDDTVFVGKHEIPLAKNYKHDLFEKLSHS